MALEVDARVSYRDSGLLSVFLNGVVSLYIRGDIVCRQIRLLLTIVRVCKLYLLTKLYLAEG